MTDDGRDTGVDHPTTNVAALARDLRTEARRADERRLLVLAGDREAGYDAAEAALDAADVPRSETTLVGPRDALGCERVGQRRADRLLGRTRTAVVADAHDALFPNALGRVVGAVDGGGLLVLVAPPLDAWPDRRDDFDATLAVPPFDVADVTGHFRRRLVDTLRAHPGVAIVDVNGEIDGGIVERDGLTDPPPRRPTPEPTAPEDARFPAAAYGACLTADQAEAVAALEALAEDDSAVVVEADRGRGKSSAAGIAAGALAADGERVLVTAPEYAAAREVFVRARALLDSMDALAGVDEHGGDPRVVRAAGGGSVRFASPPAAAEAVEADSDVTSRSDCTDSSARDAPDVLVVDEAAALPVRLLARLLAARRVVFATTVHGYEGAGRGFSVRFRDRLADSDLAVTDVRIDEPIRYAPGDPVEVWAFRALLLSAGPPADQLVADATPEGVAYRALPATELVADEHLLGEAFGLLVAAHYRTEPADLARLLDAPNVSVRALLRDGHVVSVALLAREGGLPADVRAHMYEGGRVRGNMLPDVLTGQLRDEAAGTPTGLRVLRIATHHAVRSRGLGSHLLSRVREEFAGGEADEGDGEAEDAGGEVGDAGDGTAAVAREGDGDATVDAVDWLGTGYGATPELLSFWAANGYGTVHLSTTRNATSGKHSALMLSPTSEAGRALHDRHARWFVRRAASMLSDPLSEVEPDVVRAALRTVDVTPSAEGALELDLDARDWRMVADAAYGPGLFDAAPRPFRRLVVRYLVDSGAGGPGDGDDETPLTPREERLLVAKVLQGRDWERVAESLGYHSRGQCMRALGEALQPLVDRYGDETATESKERFTNE